MKSLNVLSLFAMLAISGCGGGGGGGGSGSAGGASSSMAASSASPIPQVNHMDYPSELYRMEFFIGSAGVDLRDITLEQAMSYGSKDFVDAWIYYHDYYAPKKIIENWVSPDYDGLSTYLIRTNVDGDVSYLTINTLYDASKYEAMISSVNFMQDDVNKGSYCYVESSGSDYNASINQERLRIGANTYKNGSKLRFIPAHDNSLFGDVVVPKNPKLAFTVNGKVIAFFFKYDRDHDQNDGVYVVGIYYDGVYHTEEEHKLFAENNNFFSEFADKENKIALNLRTTRYEQGAVAAFSGKNLIKCAAEPISRSGIPLDIVYETAFDVEGVTAKSYVHIANDGLISTFTDDIENWSNCLNTGVLSRKNGGMHGVYAQYNREGHYIFIEDNSFRKFRLLLDSENKVNSIWAFNALNQQMAEPAESFTNQFYALSTTVSSVPLSDLQAAVCSPQVN